MLQSGVIATDTAGDAVLDIERLKGSSNRCLGNPTMTVSNHIIPNAIIPVTSCSYMLLPKCFYLRYLVLNLFFYRRELDHTEWRGGMVMSKMWMRQPKRLSLKVWNVYGLTTNEENKIKRLGTHS